MRRFGFVLLGFLSCGSPPAPADLVLWGGRVYTANDSSPWAEALAVRGERILAVGSRSEIERHVAKRTRVVDLDGRLVLPGFIDGYLHLRRGARFIDSPPLGEAESRDELMALVRAHGVGRPESAWVVGAGWRYHVLGRPRSRDELDAGVGGRPAFLLSQDARAAWVSSKALEIARVSSQAALLVDSAEIAAVEDAIPAGTHDSISEVVRRAHRFGITAVHVPKGEEVDEALDLRVHAIVPDPLRPRADGWEQRRGEELAPLRGAVVGVHPSKVSPDWIPLDRRAKDAFPLKSLVRSGAVVVFGSDWPFATLDPLAGIAAAVTRRDLEGRPEAGYASEERLSVEEALLAYTRNGAYAMSEENERGTLEAGKLADLAVLSADIFSIPPDRIAEAQVVLTVVAGRIVHRAPSLGNGSGLNGGALEATFSR